MRRAAYVGHAGRMTATPELGRAPARTPRLVVAILVVLAVAIPVLAFPYVLLDRDASRIDVQTDVMWIALVIHVPAASVAAVLGALQFVPRIRADRQRHRRIGRTFLAVGTLAFVVTGIPLALTTPDGNLTRFGVLVPAVLWPLLAVTAWTAIRRREVVRHQEWMTRLYALTLFAITARMVTPILLLVQVPVMDSRYGGDVQAAVAASIPYGQWLGWIVNLVVAELIIRRTRRAGLVGET
jgi:uncharacterized membrane protein YozB (DUF420 family)